jgi:hypothetical protein
MIINSPFIYTVDEACTISSIKNILRGQKPVSGFLDLLPAADSDQRSTIRLRHKFRSTIRRKTL